MSCSYQGRAGALGLSQIPCSLSLVTCRQGRGFHQGAERSHLGCKESQLFTAWFAKGSSDPARAGLECDCPALHNALPVTLVAPGVLY